MEGNNLHDDGTTPFFRNLHKMETHNVLEAALEYRRLEDGEPAGLVPDVAIAALLALNRPLGSRTWFAVNAAVFLSPRVGPERAEKIVAAASAGFEDEEHDERMLAVRSCLREHVVADPAVDAAIAAELERLAPGVPALIARWCARGREQGGAR